MWSKIKAWFHAAARNTGDDRSSGGLQVPRPDLAGTEPAWLEAEANPFGIRLLDVRPITLGTLATTGDPLMAQNAVSYDGEDGSSFATQRPAIARRLDAGLRFRAPERLADGALFVPHEMEDKWALFVLSGALVLVRSWRREVVLRAELRVVGDVLHVGTAVGAVASPDESEEYTRRALDFILRTHALEGAWPAPLIGTRDDAPRALALQCMSLFGRNAHFASFESPMRRVPTRPLRVRSRLHLAVLSGQLDKARRAVAGGVPVSLPDRFGLSAIHYVRDPGPMLKLLLANGARVDDPSDDGTTLLMFATQDRHASLIAELLDLGAAVDAVDARGFSALHRAAEMGDASIVRMLLACGADPDRVAKDGLSPRALAARGNEASVLSVLPPKG
jgi:hypothetical protein